MQNPSKSAYHHGDLRESLLRAAEAALVEMPVEQVSLREIARRAGVSHAAPKHHFASLGHLFGEVAARGFDRFVAELENAATRDANQTPRHRMMAMSRAYLRFAAQNSAVYGLMFGKRDDVVANTPHLTSAMFAAWSQLEREVGEIVGQQRAAYGAVTVWSTVHGLAMLRMDRKLPPQINPEAALEALVHMLVTGLEAEP